MSVTPAQAKSAWEHFKTKLEPDRNAGGVAGPFARIQLEVFQGFVNFVEAEAKRGTANEVFLHVVAAACANMIVQTAQMTAAPGKGRLVAEDMQRRIRQMADVHLGAKQSKLILPGLPH